MKMVIIRGDIQRPAVVAAETSLNASVLLQRSQLPYQPLALMDEHTVTKTAVGIS